MALDQTHQQAASLSSLSVLTLAGSPRLWAAHHTEEQANVPCGDGGRMHVHRFFEIVFIEDGTGRHGVGDHVVSISPGDLFLIAPGELHDSSGLGQANRWIIAFGADVLDPGRTDADLYLSLPDELLLLTFLRPQGARTGYFQVPPADRPRWLSRLDQLVAELGDRQFGFSEAARALLILILTDVARLAAPHLSAYTLASRPLLTRVFRFIEAHYAEPISLRHVAAAVGHARAYLTSLVRRETGRTVQAWIVERRMAEARYLLLETDQPVRLIATGVGYRYPGHFIRQFRTLHGTTPEAWRHDQFAGQRPVS